MASNQKVNIETTTYRIGYGTTMYDGAIYNIRGGKTTLGSTEYNIEFPKPVNNVATARLYSNGHMQFQVNDRNEATSTNTLVASYTGFLVNQYNGTNRPWYSKKDNITSIAFDPGIKPKSTAYWCYGSSSIKDFYWDNLDMSNVTNMYGMFDYVATLNANTPIRTGPNVSQMAYAYENCKLIRGPVGAIGPKVTNMRYSFSNCFNLRGSPVCGPNVTSFEGTYYQCNKITGSPAWSNTITSGGMAYFCCYLLNGKVTLPPHLDYVRYAYGYCRNVTGSPVCSDNVVNFYGTYCQCNLITGNFVCGNKVDDMGRAYESCRNLSGHAIVGPNVSNAYIAYAGCTQITEAYIKSNRLTNARGLFQGTPNTTRLNIFIKPGAGATTLQTLLGNVATNSITNTAITWTQSGQMYYNTAYNIYIYNNTAFNEWIADAVYWPNATHLIFTNKTLIPSSVPAANQAILDPNKEYNSYTDVPWEGIYQTLTNVKVLYPTIQPISLNYWFYFFSNLSKWEGQMIDGSRVRDIRSAFDGCTKLSIEPNPYEGAIWGHRAYYNCTNLKGSPVITSNIVEADWMYCNCVSLTGPPSAGTVVKNMYGTYQNCIRLTGEPVFCSEVEDIGRAYCNCTNLTGSGGIFIPPKVKNMFATFENATSLSSGAEELKVIIQSPLVENMVNCFANTGFTSLHPIRIAVPFQSSTYYNAHKASTYGLNSVNWSYPTIDSSYNAAYGIWIYYI